MLFVSESNMQWYRRGHNEHDWKSCCRQKRHEGSNPSHCAILTKRYRCVWRKARRINRFRAFSGLDFFFQTIDANRCFRASAPIRTGRFLFSGRCIQPALFLSSVFHGWQRYFSQKNSQRLGRRFVGPDGLRKRRPFSFQKGRWCQRQFFVGRSMIALALFFCTREELYEHQRGRKEPLPQRSSDRPCPRRISDGQDSYWWATCPA